MENISFFCMFSKTTSVTMYVLSIHYNTDNNVNTICMLFVLQTIKHFHFFLS